MAKIQGSRPDFWRQFIAQQEQSGLSVRAFCHQHQASEHSFYQWRKRLAAQRPMNFALVQPSLSASGATSALELVLVSGERLRIESGIDAATLRVVLSVLRESR